MDIETSIRPLCYVFTIVGKGAHTELDGIRPFIITCYSCERFLNKFLDFYAQLKDEYFFHYRNFSAIR